MVADIIDMLKEKNIQIQVDDAVCKHLCELGYDEKQGARPLRRALQMHLEDKIADQMLQKGYRENVSIKISMKQKEIVFAIRKLNPKIYKSKQVVTVK